MRRPARRDRRERSAGILLRATGAHVDADTLRATGAALMATQRVETRCCIAGGGPAGMMLGLLLARAGVDVLVLEKHADFLRDFRGDTIHPSTLEVMHELGILGDLLQLPHQEARTLTAQVGDVTLAIADFTRLPTRCGFIA